MKFALILSSLLFISVFILGFEQSNCFHQPHIHVDVSQISISSLCSRNGNPFSRRLQRFPHQFAAPKSFGDFEYETTPNDDLPSAKEETNNMIEDEAGGLLTDEDMEIFRKGSGSKISEAENVTLLTEDDLRKLENPDERFASGVSQLFITTILFSTNAVAIRYLYSVIDNHPPVFLFNACAALCAAITGIIVSSAASGNTESESRLLTDRETQLAGTELGFWKFVGATFNVIGLSMTTASQAGFCTQMTTLIVPFLESFLGVPIPGRVWAACLIAVAGVGAITLDSVSSVASPELAQTILTGDLLCILGAVFYATFDVRLNFWEKTVTQVDLVTGKMLSQTFFSFLAVAALILADPNQMAEINAFFSSANLQELLIIMAVMLWNGCIVNFLATYIQVPAQAIVGPSRSQVVYSSNPLMSALLSFAILGESFSMRGLVGGAAFISALLIAASAPTSISEKGDEEV